VIGTVQRVPDKRRPDIRLGDGWQTPSRSRPKQQQPAPLSWPRGLVLKADPVTRTAFPVIQTARLESSRSSITFRFEAFEFSDPKGALHLDSNRIKGLAFDGERGRRGTVRPVTPQFSRQVPPPPTGSPGGSPDASD